MGKSAHPPGWYTDLKVRGRLRYWDGGRWSEFIADLPPSADVRRLGEDLDAFVRFVCEREALPPTLSQQLELECDRYVHTYARRWRVRQWGGAVSGEPSDSAAPLDAAPPIPAALVTQVTAAPDVVPEPASTAPTPVAVGSQRPVTQVAAAQTTDAQVAPPPTVEPRFGPTLVERFRHAVAGDLALHGMAYLGILLL
ncbi:MAG TPA: DUF2510 domain-containing protein, partial [Ilumatobacteraceae bacterium]|nr:DUF2510 domain-containing protein [Ilumatobacteraceae bacterium]